MVTLAKQNDLAARRRALSYVMEPAAVHKLFTVLGPRFAARPGGYTRVEKTRARRGDNAPLAFLSYLPDGEPTRAMKKRAQRTIQEESESRND